MAIKYSYLKKDNIVKVEAVGLLSISEVETYVKQLINDKNVDNGFIEVFNLQGVQDFDFSFHSGKKIVTLYSKLQKYKNYRGTIHISSSDVQHGVSHVMTAILENVSMVFTIEDKSEINVALNQFKIT